MLGDGTTVDAWAAVVESRRPDRFDVVDVLRAGESEGLVLRGDGAGNDDDRCRVQIGRVCGVGAVILFHRRDRHGDAVRGASLGATAYRQYRRGIELAGELGLPVVSFIDTQGAATTPEDEEGGWRR